MYDEWDWEMHARDERWREDAEDLREAMQDEEQWQRSGVATCECGFARTACECLVTVECSEAA